MSKFTCHVAYNQVKYNIDDRFKKSKITCDEMHCRCGETKAHRYLLSYN